MSYTLSDDFGQQRREISDLWMIPAGAKVVLHVGRVCLIDSWVVGELRTHSSRLAIDVHGTPEAVRHWITEIREAA